MTDHTRQPQLWGEDSRRIYWWHLPVRPERAASLGRDMILTLIIWVVSMVVLMGLIDLIRTP